MNLYSCLWQRGTMTEQPFALALGGGMRLTAPRAVRQAYAAYDALAGEENTVLTSIMNYCNGKVRIGGVSKLAAVTMGVQRALFLHCFPGFINHRLDFGQGYSYHQCGKGGADRNHVKLHFPWDWWHQVYRSGEAITSAGDLIIARRYINNGHHRYIVRPLDEEQLTLRIEEQWQMMDGEWQ